MDKKTLYRLFYLPKQIELKRWEIQRLEERLTSISPSLTGMPHGSGAYDKIGENVPELVEKKERLEQMVHDWEIEEREIEDWIDAIEDLHINLLFSLRFKERMNWQEVADMAGGKNTEESVRKQVDRYLRRKQVEEENAKMFG